MRKERQVVKKHIYRALVFGGCVSAAAADAAYGLFAGLTDSATAVAGRAENSGAGIAVSFLCVIAVFVMLFAIWGFGQKRT